MAIGANLGHRIDGIRFGEGDELAATLVIGNEGTIQARLHWVDQVIDDLSVSRQWALEEQAPGAQVRQLTAALWEHEALRREWLTEVN